MATIRKRKDKWQVQIRRKGSGAISRSFHALKDAEEWARHMEVRADRRDLPADPAALRGVTLGQLVERYRDTVSPRKRTYELERMALNAFIRHPICRRPVSDLTGTHFAAYRDERLKRLKPSSVKRELVPIRNLFEVARAEWDLPIRENPLSKLKFADSDQRRERRLRPGEHEALIEAAKLTRNSLILPIVTLALETAKSYGSKAREWQMDTVILMKRESANEAADIQFSIEFTKARERTPRNRSDFDEVTISLRDDRWHSAHIERMSKDAGDALRTLETLILGQVQPGSCGDKMVPREEWRRRTYEKWPNKADEAKKKAFQRANASLAKGRKLAVNGQCVGLGNPMRPGTSETMSLH
jgi:hypothetical protein